MDNIVGIDVVGIGQPIPTTCRLKMVIGSDFQEKESFIIYFSRRLVAGTEATLYRQLVIGKGQPIQMTYRREMMLTVFFFI